MLRIAVVSIKCRRDEIVRATNAEYRKREQDFPFSVFLFGLFRQNRGNIFVFLGNTMYNRERKKPMKRNWIGTIILVSVSIVIGFFLSQTWEQVHGQHSLGQHNPGQPGFFMEGQQVVPQVVVQQQPEMPKWFVDFVSLPPLPGEHIQRFRAITIVDAETKKIAVYHSDITTGAVRLLSVRNIQPDLMLDQFNATSPLPSEIIREMQRLGDGNR